MEEQAEEDAAATAGTAAVVTEVETAGAVARGAVEEAAMAVVAPEAAAEA